MFKNGRRGGAMPLIALLALCFSVSSQGAFAEAWVNIDNLSVTPRMASDSETDDFDTISQGINTVGVGKTVYLQFAPTDDAATSISGYGAWSVDSEPATGAAVVVAETEGLLKVQLTAAGAYQISITPTTDLPGVTPEAGVITLFAAGYQGVDAGAPACSSCHAETATAWRETQHATMLEESVNGHSGSYYASRCISCHTVGGFDATPGDGNFFQVAEGIGFDLDLIGAWAADGANNGVEHWDEMPAELQTLGNIQCENCHGPGDAHKGDAAKISAGMFDSEVCDHCHDAPTHHMRPYQWRASAHSNDPYRTSGSCAPCHTGEGFAYLTAKGLEEIPENVTTRGPITCVSCHDPHDATNPHQLRTVSAVALPNGQGVFNGGYGNLCVNCHNSRRDVPPSTLIDPEQDGSTRRGAHHGPQGDIMLGASMYDWGTSYTVGQGVHYDVTENACVTCHMAEPLSHDRDPLTIGDHTFAITLHGEDGSTTSTVESSCGAANCHPGLTTTDRVPLVAHDYDGNGVAQGIQTEIAGLMELVAALLESQTGLTRDEGSFHIGVEQGEWEAMTMDQRGALYNLNILAEDGSLGIHNSELAAAALQRSYGYLAGALFGETFGDAEIVDPEGGVFDPIPVGANTGLIQIDNLSVTPRIASDSETDAYDVNSPGINTVGIGKTVYLQPIIADDAAASVTAITWTVLLEPTDLAAVITTSTADLLKFSPTLAGEYLIQLDAMIDDAPTTPAVITINASTYLGADAAPAGTASCTGCHAETGSLWRETAHASMLEESVNGHSGSYYSSNCISCHTVGGYDPASRGDGNFFEVAEAIGFDLDLIGTWAGNGEENWDKMPAELQALGNIQCENCHGPGGNHAGDTAKITMPDAEVCDHCHDAPTHHMRPYQWRASGHANEPYRSTGSCAPCHTGEGFTYLTAKGLDEIPAKVTARGPITCIACHDPHDDTNSHQLRTVAPVALPNGQGVFDSGNGNLCVNCHNSRRDVPPSVLADPEQDGSTRRGAHHGPQGDIMLGASMYDWGTTYTVGVGVHYVMTEDACVTCHMADPLTHDRDPLTIGDHTFAITLHNEDGSTTATVGSSCGATECHPGLTKIDRVPLIAKDYDGNGVAEGIQTEIGALMELVAAKIEADTGLTRDEGSFHIGVSQDEWEAMTQDQRGALYNLNILAEDGSLGIHNSKLAAAALQRSYKYLNGGVDVENADLIDREDATDPIPADANTGAVQIENMAVTPRTVSDSETDDFDVVSPGINTVGVGKAVYLVPVVDAEATVTGLAWSIVTEPSAGAATVLVDNEGLLKFRPTVEGEYQVLLTPSGLTGDDAAPAAITLWVSTYRGVDVGREGVASCTDCHADMSAKWAETDHASMLKNSINGHSGSYYSSNCVSCHTVGGQEATTGDGNFFDVAAEIGFDLSLIGTWATDGANNGVEHWEELPAELKAVGNIQCENCHGPGDTHGGDTSRISAGAFDAKVCDYCHDAPTHHMRPYQWRSSAHAKDPYRATGSCAPCHSAEGYAYAAKGMDIPDDVTPKNGITCVACHDPHDATNEHQLRAVGAVALPNGMGTFDGGKGNVCAKCHNSRRDVLPSTLIDPSKDGSTRRGAHHGPQSDIMLGVSVYDWDTPYTAGASVHNAVVDDTCVTCHMAANPEHTRDPAQIGDHTFAINVELEGGVVVSNAPGACGGCHEGLATTDRVLGDVDYDGNGTVEGIQSEVAGIMENLVSAFEAETGVTRDEGSFHIGVDQDTWTSMTMDQRGVLYNINIFSEDGSLGIHNGPLTIEVLKRSYLHLTGAEYDAQDFFERPDGLPTGALYKVTTKDATLAVEEVSAGVVSLALTGTTPKSSIKIQLQKKEPKKRSTKPGVIYLDDLTYVHEFDIAGAFGKISTDVRTGRLTAAGAVKSITTKNASVDSINAGPVGTIKMTALRNDQVDTAGTTIVTTGPAPMKLTLAGIILENLDTAQACKYIKLASKAWKDKATKVKYVSLGGANGTIIAGGAKTIDAKGASITCDLIRVAADIANLKAQSKKLNKIDYPAGLGTPGSPASTQVVAPNIKTIVGTTGVSGVFLVGVTTEGVADYSGAIKSITAKTGVLEGEAHVSPAAKPIKFKPAQGAFLVITAAPAAE